MPIALPKYDFESGYTTNFRALPLKDECNSVKKMLNSFKLSLYQIIR